MSITPFNSNKFSIDPEEICKNIKILFDESPENAVNSLQNAFLDDTVEQKLKKTNDIARQTLTPKPIRYNAKRIFFLKEEQYPEVAFWLENPLKTKDFQKNISHAYYLIDKGKDINFFKIWAKDLNFSPHELNKIWDRAKYAHDYLHGKIDEIKNDRTLKWVEKIRLAAQQLDYEQT